MFKIFRIWVLSAFVANASIVSKASIASNASNGETGKASYLLRGDRNLKKDSSFMVEFKEQNQLNDNFDGVIQGVAGDTFAADFKTVSFADINVEPMVVFSETAEYYMNGHKQDSLPPPSVFRGKDDPSLIVTKDGDGRLQRARMNDNTGKSMSLVPVEAGSDVFVTVHESDIDARKLKKFKYGNGNTGRSERFLRDTNSTYRELSTSPCSTFKIIEMAVAYESLFCAHFGGSPEAADSAVQTIVAETSLKYQEGLCIKVVMSHLEGYCNPATDPYATQVLQNAPDACGALPTLRDYWRANRANVHRDTVQFFHGFDFPDSVIGCAWLTALCGSYGYGVNQITFSNNQVLWSVLLAHELGHNAGSDHDCSGCENVMRPSICSGCQTFSSGSIESINTFLASPARSCIATEAAEVPEIAETQSPSESPTTSTSCEDDLSVTFYLGGGATADCTYFTDSQFYCRFFVVYDNCRTTCDVC